MKLKQMLDNILTQCQKNHDKLIILETKMENVQDKQNDMDDELTPIKAHVQQVKGAGILFGILLTIATAFISLR